MENEFIQSQNITIIWNLLGDSYPDKIVPDFRPYFNKVIKEVYDHKGVYNNLIEMNKAVLMKCSKKIIEKKPVSFDYRLKETEQNFKSMMEKPPPKEINFEDKKIEGFNENVSDLLSKQMSSRSQELETIKKNYNTKNAENWINNTIPPSLTIDHDTHKEVKSEKITKHVTFKEPNDFLAKLKKNIKSQYSCISPDKIENNKMFFLKSLGYVSELKVSKLFMKNKNWKKINILFQESIIRSSHTPFIIFSICINENLKKNNLLFTKKYNDNRNIIYESNTKIIVNEEVKKIEISLYDRYNTPLSISPVLHIEKQIRGSELIIQDDQLKHFGDKNFYYIIFVKDVIYTDERILINGEEISIIGTCLIKDRILIDIKDVKTHNCSIIEWEKGEIHDIQCLSSLPKKHFKI